MNDGGTITNVLGLSGDAPYTQSTYAAAGWNFGAGGAWVMIDGETRPFLRSEYTTSITNAHQLQLVQMNPAASYTLASDIDMSELSNPSGMWRTSARPDASGGYGFVPLGTNGRGSVVGNGFTGTFDGQGHVVDGLIINRPNADLIGLFGYAQNATIRNVGLTDVDITGRNYVGGLVGYSVASGTGATASITQAYATGTVRGSNLVGGLVGKNYESSRSDMCYIHLGI